MKSKIKWAFIVASIFLAFSMLTCVNQDINNLRKDAALLDLRVGSIQILASDPSGYVEGRPEPINTTEWNREDFNMSSAAFGRVAFYRPGDLYQQRVVTRVSPGAQAEWGLGMRGSRPGEFIDTRVPITFESDEYIYIRVTAEDGVTRNYYRFYTKLLSWTTDLAQIAIKIIPLDPNESDTFRIGKAAMADTEFEMAEEANIGITTAEGQNATIVPTTFDPNATVEFAVVDDDATDPEDLFQPSHVPQSFNDQDLLYVKVTAENTVDFAIFKFRVNVGRMSTINKLFVVNKDPPDQTPEAGKTIEIYGKGLPSAIWESVGLGSHATADPPGAGYAITIQPDDPDADYWWTKLPDADEPNSGFDDPEAVWFDQGEVLAIKVQSKNPDNDGNYFITYYKVRVNLLAGNIETHPKSAWYMRGATVTPLTVELDREGSFSYQWYHSDSLYGLYGRHGMDLDEKNNVSTMNGGPSMYYYLVEPDSTDTHTGQPWAWTLVGETGPSYTPRNDWIDIPIVTTEEGGKTPVVPVAPEVNFITGSTSEVRYYWVTVTDNVTGRTVTSDRCLILTETDPNMKHFIFDLSVLNKKNIVPFITKKNDPNYGDQPYKFDVKAYMASVDLDPSDFEICVAQAQYFLPDGRPWTQNWTHGDLHFGYDPGSKNADGSEKGNLTWWHNNLGANAGAIPLQAPHSSQGGLSFKPDWVGFKPSGDPDRGLPPPWWVSSRGVPTDGLPKGTYPGTPSPPGGTAQGYFCGFIELLELRFATAPSQ